MKFYIRLYVYTLVRPKSSIVTPQMFHHIDPNKITPNRQKRN